MFINEHLNLNFFIRSFLERLFCSIGSKKGSRQAF